MTNLSDIENQPMGGIQPLPEIKRDDTGKMYSDSAAAVAIAGMADSELVRRLVELERQHTTWCQTLGDLRHWEPDLPVVLTRKAIRRVQAIVEAAEKINDTARAQVAELALAHQNLLSEVNQAGIRQSFMLEHDRMAADLRGLRAFLKEHFGGDMDRAESLNTPLLETAKLIMLRNK